MTDSITTRADTLRSSVWRKVDVETHNIQISYQSNRGTDLGGDNTASIIGETRLVTSITLTDDNETWSEDVYLIIPWVIKGSMHFTEEGLIRVVTDSNPTTGHIRLVDQYAHDVGLMRNKVHDAYLLKGEIREFLDELVHDIQHVWERDTFNALPFVHRLDRGTPATWTEAASSIPYTEGWSPDAPEVETCPDDAIEDVSEEDDGFRHGLCPHCGNYTTDSHEGQVCEECADQMEEVQVFNPDGPDLVFKGWKRAHVSGTFIALNLYQTASGNLVAHYQNATHNNPCEQVQVIRQDETIFDFFGWGQLAKELYKTAGIPYTEHVE